MADTKYTQEHEWLRVDGDVGTIGITQYAQEQGLSPTRIDYLKFFHPEAAGLAGV